MKTCAKEDKYCVTTHSTVGLGKSQSRLGKVALSSDHCRTLAQQLEGSLFGAVR